MVGNEKPGGGALFPEIVFITRQIAEGAKGNVRAALADLEMWLGRVAGRLLFRIGAHEGLKSGSQSGYQGVTWFDGVFWMISHETIYQHVADDTKAGGTLASHLRINGYLSPNGFLDELGANWKPSPRQASRNCEGSPQQHINSDRRPRPPDIR